MDSTFDLATACQCVALAQRAYESPNLTTDLAHVLVEEDANYLNIACRGTASIRDFISDADFVRVPLFEGSPVSVHRGCRRAVNSVLSHLEDKVSAAPKPVRFTGHSLGGMMATQLARCFVARGIPVASVYTYGEPRGGNAAYAALCDQLFGINHHRVVHEEDIVSRIPGYFIGYRHSGHEDFLPSLPDGSVSKIWFDPSELEKFLSDCTGMYRAWKATRNIWALDDLLTCHHLDGYVKALNQLAAGQNNLPIRAVHSPGQQTGAVNP